MPRHSPRSTKKRRILSKTPAKSTAKTPTKSTAKTPAKSKGGGKKAKAAAAAPPKDVGAVRTAMRELFEDICVAQAAPTPSGYDAREKAKDGARMLYGDFVRNAAHRVRAAMVGPRTDLAALMDVIKDGGAVGGDPFDPRNNGKSGRLCQKNCRFVGAANHAACLRAPESIVSICSPDASADGDCRFTLCFDAAELGDQIRAFRQSGRSHMPNPALADRILNPELLRPELDEETVAGLEWQVRLAGERAALRAAEVTAADHYVLVSVVLPAMVRYISQFQPVEAIVHLYKRFTPSIVKRLFSRAGNALLVLLDNPWLSSLAFIVTKVIRTLSCFAAFGVREGDKERIRSAILAVADPNAHSPTIAMMVTMVIESLACVSNVLSGNPTECIGRAFYASAVTLPKWVFQCGTNVMTGLMRGVGGPLGMVAQGVDEWIATLKVATGEVGIGSLFYAMVKAVANGPEAVADGVNDLWDTVTHDKRIVGMVGDLGADGFGRFYNLSTFSVTTGVLLWLSRKIRAETALSLLKLMPWIGDAAFTMVVNAVETLRAQSPGTTVALHRVIMFVLESAIMRENLRAIGAVVANLAVLMQCFGAVLMNRLGVGGMIGAGKNSVYCCTTGLITKLEDHEKAIKAQALEIEQRERDRAAAAKQRERDRAAAAKQREKDGIASAKRWEERKKTAWSFFFKT